MKKLAVIFSITLFIVACSTNKKDSETNDNKTPEVDKNLVTYKYKVVGLQDSIVSDSIWRIIFQVDGIDKLVLSKDDSMAVFTVDPELVDESELEQEIASRGGVVLK
jgi:PBP1b-binding outer membrane lipoprotein LpoB